MIAISLRIFASVWLTLSTAETACGDLGRWPCCSLLCFSSRSFTRWTDFIAYMEHSDTDELEAAAGMDTYDCEV